MCSPSVLPTGAAPRGGGGELPAPVEVAPGVTRELGAGVFRQGVVRPDLVGPLRAQFVRGAVGAAAPEGADRLAVPGGDEAARAVVAQVGGAACGAGLVADDGFLERDEERSGVGGVQLGRCQGPLGTADHGLEVVDDGGRGRGQFRCEVEPEGAAVRLDGGREGAVVVVAVGQPERRLRDRHLRAAGFGPAQMEVGAAVVLEVLQLEVMGVTRRQVDGLGGLFAIPVVHPVVDDGPAVDPETETVVADDREGGGSALLRYEFAGPADADIVVLARGEAQPGFQVVEVELRVEAGGLEFVEVEGAGGGLGVVVALQPVHRDGIVGRGGHGGESRGTEGRGEQ